MKAHAGTSSCYLYAMAEAGLPLPEGLAGLDGEPLTTVAAGPVMAVASTIHRRIVRPERALLKAHNDVLAALMQKATVLPFAFGVMAADPDELRGFIHSRSDLIATELLRLQGTIEMGLSARLRVPDVYDYLLEVSPGLREARDALLGSGRVPGRDQRIALGVRVEQAIDAFRERHVAQLLPVLQQHCTDLCRNSEHEIDVVMNLACLVRRERRAAFENALDDAVREMDGRIAFELSGPWAPHHFCRIALSSEGGFDNDR